MTQPAGVVDLCVPADWAELVLPDAHEAEHAFAELVRRTWPRGPEALWSSAASVLHAWRRALMRRGAVSFGLVSVPRPDAPRAEWQVLTSVVRLPADPDIDVTAVLARMCEDQGAHILHVERFDTAMGLGVGLVATREIRPARLPGMPVTASDGQPIRMGMAAALACEPGGRDGLLVVGVCFAVEQTADLAALVAVIAGRSRVRPGPQKGSGIDT
ncbi:hypothetical protein DQ237_12295 [Blastococcus sp. TF02-8]|uniref:hypothetical protein n=1 Tax=Blastococcus sp. TF02-8 TaxID=2250574 RepID=UPI000DEBB530|nr:hypothetical protein [Blastococcus sp. TF02-8]RBY95913.1 hypothetical protein DQ237_12295 [Blastococcus sp. TF02-8]